MSNDQFVLTEDHIKLLRASNVLDEVNGPYEGSACIDPKRPYGSSSMFEESIARILDIELIDDEYLECADREYCLKVHNQTALALQIVLATGSFVPGLYRRRNRYDSNSWYLVEDPQI